MTTTITGSGVSTGSVAASSVASTTESFTNPPLVTTPQSMVRLNTANGYGSTNTVIRRFTNVVTNQGTDITYADSATLGASFTINVNGVYAIGYTDDFTASITLGLSLNSTQLTTAIYSITPADALAIAQTTGVNTSQTANWTGYIAAGSIVRAHGQPGTSGASGTCKFTITRVA